MMLSASEVQQHLRDWYFHGLCKQLLDSIHYVNDDARITYPQIMTAAQKAESEKEDHTGEVVHVRSIQAGGKDDITRLSEQIVQLSVVVQKYQNTTISNPWQSGSEKDGNRKKR